MVETTSFVIDEMFSSVPPWEFSLLKNGGKKMENPAKITYMTFKVWMLRHVRWEGLDLYTPCEFDISPYITVAMGYWRNERKWEIPWCLKRTWKKTGGTTGFWGYIGETSFSKASLPRPRGFKFHVKPLSQLVAQVFFLWMKSSPVMWGFLPRYH